MTTPVNLNAAEIKILAALAINTEDYPYSNFRGLARVTRLKRPEIRRACRSLRRKGLAVFGKGLCDDDGALWGSGYAATEAGRDRADSKLVERYDLKHGCY